MDQLAQYELADAVDRRLRSQLSACSGWIAQAQASFLYYRSDQLKRRSGAEDRNRIRHVANFIRRDVDLIASEILDGKPVVNPIGRSPRYYELGRQLVQVMEWSRDEEEDWHDNLEKAITFCVHIGEGILYEGWDQDADDGRGLPASVAIDPRYFYWDPRCQRMQRDDAEWMIWMSMESLEQVKEQFPDLAERLQPETEETYLLPARGPLYERNGGFRNPNAGPAGPDKDEERIWVKRQWTKKRIYRKMFYYKDSSEPAMAVVDGEEKPLDQAAYNLLSKEEKAQVISDRVRIQELWETTVLNQYVAEHKLSPFDRSNGGHGHYPFAFFSYEIVPDETRARGEIGFLMQSQDLMNETVTQLLEQMFLNNVGYWHAFKGTMAPEERDKLDQIAYRPHRVIETYQGSPPPQHVGVDPSGMNSAAQMLPIIKDIADKTSGIHDVDRGEIPGHIQSGRAIRALQAKTSRLNVKVKRHIESGLRRATHLRLHNIMQFLRGPRVIEITDPKQQGGKMLYMGFSEEEVATYYSLQQAPSEDPQAKGKMVWVNGSGDEAEIMVLNDQLSEDVVFERVKLTLDTGQEANRLERMDQAEMVLNIVGKPGIPWAGKQLEWSNLDELLAAIEKEDMAAQIMGQDEQLQKELGIGIMEAIEMVKAMYAAKQQQGPPDGSVPPPGAGGPGPPPPGSPATPEQAMIGPPQQGPPPGMTQRVSVGPTQEPATGFVPMAP